MGLFNPKVVNTTRVAIPDDPELDFVGAVPFSISCWVRMPSGFNQETWAALIAKLDNRWRVSVIDFNDYGWHFITPSTFNFTFNNNDDILHHFAFVKEGSGAGESKQYIDGGLAGTSGGGTMAGPNGGDVWITNNSSQTNRALQAEVMDMRIYNRALSPAEIQTIHGVRGTDGIVDGLIARWQFNDGAPGTLVGTTLSLTGKHNGTGGPGGNEPLYIGNEIKGRRRSA